MIFHPNEWWPLIEPLDWLWIFLFLLKVRKFIWKHNLDFKEVLYSCSLNKKRKIREKINKLLFIVCHSGSRFWILDSGFWILEQERIWIFHINLNFKYLKQLSRFQGSITWLSDLPDLRNTILSLIWDSFFDYFEFWMYKIWLYGETNLALVCWWCWWWCCLWLWLWLWCMENHHWQLHLNYYLFVSFKLTIKLWIIYCWSSNALAWTCNCNGS